MKQLLITLTTALLLAGCGPEDSNHAAAQNAAAAKAEQRAAQERQQSRGAAARTGIPHIALAVCRDARSQWRGIRTSHWSRHRFPRTP